MRDSRAGPKHLWLLWIPFLLGLGIPIYLFSLGISEMSPDVWAGMLPVAGVHVYWINIKLGKAYPKLRDWALDTLSGLACLLFFSSLAVSLACTAFATLSLSLWMKIAIGVIGGISGFLIIVQSARSK